MSEYTAKRNFHGTSEGAHKRWAKSGHRKLICTKLSAYAKQRALKHRINMANAISKAMTGEGNPFFGRHHSEKSRRLIASGNAAYRATNPQSNTKLERALYVMLWEAGISFRAQEPRAGFVVDALDEQNGLAWEASGVYWHSLREQQQPGYERRRNAALVASGLNYVVHLDERDLAPWLDQIYQREKEVA